MTKYQFGFIGCGNMGGALVTAVAKTVPAQEILIADMLADHTARLHEKCGVCVAQDAAQVAAEAEHIFLGVKPQGMGALLAELSPILRARKDDFLLITMAAGLTIETIESMAGLSSLAIVRIMPNTPAAVGQGMMLYCCNGQVTEEQEKTMLHALRASGRIDKLEEKWIDAGCALSGCGPAFVYLFMEALADGAVACGLPRQKAMLYAAQTVAGAAEMVLQSEKHPGELKDAVCSPGGSTIQGVRALEQGAFRATAMDAVIAAYEKNKELGKK